MPSNDEKNMLYMLRCALWHILPDRKQIIGRWDTKKVLRLARRQSVEPLVSRAIDDMLENADSDDETTIIACQTTMMTNARIFGIHDNVIARVIRTLTDGGLHPILIKGQGIARNYNFPELRALGDIDIFIGPENVERAKGLLLSLAGAKDHHDEFETEKHDEVEIDGIIVELHRFVIEKDFKKTHDTLSDLATKELSADGTDRVMIGGEDVAVPSPFFNAIFIFYHFWHHFISGGIGLRQICDWVCLLDKYGSTIDSKKLEAVLSKAHLLREWKIFASLAVDYLGLAKNKMPLYEEKYHRLACRAINFILLTGNFNKEHHEEVIASREGQTLFHRTMIGIRSSMDLWRHTFVVSPHYVLINVGNAFRQWISLHVSL